MNASLDGAQEGWDTKISNAEDAQEKTQDRFDARWDRRKKTVEKYWDARINKIDKAMEAEQKSEELRQRIFEAEQTRIDRMAESANRTIDFNIALQTGDLDEAAKLRNDMEATAAEWALGDGAEAGSRKSDARLDKMDKQKSSLETMRDNEMEALDKREEAERKHLDKIQEMHMDNLNAQSEANMDYLRKDWDQQKKAYDDKLELFESLPAANQKQLLKALTAAGLSLDDFGLNTLNPKANQWGGFFETSLKRHIKKAGNEIAQDNMWEMLGQRSTKELLFGMGFGGMAAFKKFMADGVLPDDFGKPQRPNPGAKGGAAPTRPGDTGYGPLSQHTGGWAGEGGNRKGVARTQKGLHQNEVMIRAQKEEFIVNKTAAKMHGGLLENINSGRFRDTVSNKGNGVGGASGIVGLMAGAMNVGFAKGVAKALSNAYNARKAGAGTKSAGPLGSAVGLGKGYLPGSGGWALPSVPGKGWRNTHDYANGEGSPLFAYNDGVVVDSKATVSGGTVGNGNYATPYRSYGETIAIRGVDGRTVRYAHLMPGGRYVKSGQQVKGGALIGRSGNTGNSTGPHTHFDINGDYNASNWFAKNGIGLKSGGVTKTDGMANLHKDEVVVDPKRTKTIYQGIDDMQGVWTWLSGMKTKKMLSERNSGKNTSDLSDSGSNSDVSTGTYNVLFATSNKATKGDLSELMTKADVLSLTEMSGSKDKLHDWFGQKGWGRVGDGDAEVIWNNKKYEALKTGNRQLNSITGSTPASKKRIASYALLKDRETGRQFWQVAAHTLGQLKAGPNGDAIRNQQWENLNKLYNELSKSAPVFLGGDLNTDLRRGNIPIGNTESNWAGNMGGSNYTIKRSFFDHVLYGPMAQLMGQQVVGGLSSDHNALLTQFNIPGLSKGAENIRWDNTMANLHKGEAVLTKDISEKFRRGVDNFASGGNNEYTIKVTVMNPQADPDEIAGAVMTAIERKEGRKPTRRRR
jgi:murein DD-endopeptidase MepM/ murein hydrolase activator NlpD